MQQRQTQTFCHFFLFMFFFIRSVCLCLTYSIFISFFLSSFHFSFSLPFFLFSILLSLSLPFFFFFPTFNLFSFCSSHNNFKICFFQMIHFNNLFGTAVCPFFDTWHPSKHTHTHTHVQVTDIFIPLSCQPISVKITTRHACHVLQAIASFSYWFNWLS